MKNFFKPKKIYAFLLAMVMCVSLFFFSGCAAEDEKLLLKIVYRPHPSLFYLNSWGTLKTYEEGIREDLDKTAENILTRVVGAFGIGDIDFKQTDGETITLRPELDEYYYSDLLGIYEGDSNYDDVIFKITQTSNIIYLSGYDSSSRILVLSNHSVNSRDVEDLVTYDETNSEFKAVSTLTEIVSQNNYKYNDVLDKNCVYLYDAGNEYSFVFVGSYAYRTDNSFNGTTNARRYVTKLLSSNYNNIQQTVDYVDIADGVDVNVTSTSWNFSLTESEMSGVYTAKDYLEEYMNKYKMHFKVELAKAILTRSECVLSEELQTLYEYASRPNARDSDREEFIEGACLYIDHFGLLNEEIESVTKFILETAMGFEISEGNDKLVETCEKFLTAAQEDLGYVPLLEVVCVKVDELEKLIILGYIQSIIFLKEDDSFKFDGLFCIMGFDEEITEPVAQEGTVRHQDFGNLQEYPVALSEADYKDGAISVELSSALEGTSSIEVSGVSKDPIPGRLNPYIKLVEHAKEYKDKFVYSTSTENTDGMCWCFNDENSSYVEFTLGYKNTLCIAQHWNIQGLFF